MRVDAALISYLEVLSALTLSDEEKQRLIGDLDEILGYMNSLSGLETQSAPAYSLAFAGIEDREDVVTPSLPREKLLQNAPKCMNGMFAAPRAV